MKNTIPSSFWPMVAKLKRMSLLHLFEESWLNLNPRTHIVEISCGQSGSERLQELDISLHSLRTHRRTSYHQSCLPCLNKAARNSWGYYRRIGTLSTNLLYRSCLGY